MITRTKPPQLHTLPAFNLLRIAIAPLDGNFGIRIGVDKNVECAVPRVEGWEECYGCGDLAEEGAD